MAASGSTKRELLLEGVHWAAAPKAWKLARIAAKTPEERRELLATLHRLREGREQKMRDVEVLEVVHALCARVAREVHATAVP